MRLPFRLRLTLVYTGLFILFGVVLVLVVAAVLNRLLDGRSLRSIPEVLENQTLSELRASELVEIVREARQAERQRLVRAAVRVVAIVFLLLSVAGAVGAWVLAGQMLRPLTTITAHARAASASTLSSRIALRGPDDELKDLADTYDALLEHLDVAFRSQRRFSAQVSHELRTQLAVAQAEADVLLASPDLTERERQFATRVRAAVARNEALIDAMLVLSRAESRLIDRSQLDLAEIVGDVVGELAAMAAEHEVRLDLDLAGAQLRGDPVLLARMVTNLVSNGIRHNHPAGWARVEVGSGFGGAVLAVTNSGPVVVDAESLLAPFITGATAQPGAGLGLAIAGEVAAAHGGDLRIEARPEGGLRVRVELPAP